MNIRALVRHQWDRVAALACLVAGLINLFLGYIGASGTRKPEEQIPYLASNGLLGLSLIAVAVTLWLSADMRDEWCKLDELTSALQPRTEASPESRPEPMARTVAARESTRTPALVAIDD
jgi:hypothetical protein